MGSLVRFTPTNVTKEKYDESLRRLKEAGEFPPEGMELHVAFGPEDNMRVRGLGFPRAAAGFR
jgi:hypothetical protein